MKVVFEAEAVLYHVREKVRRLNRENGESAFKYAIDLRDTMQQQTKIGIDKVKSMILDNVRNIKNELGPLDITAQDIFKEQVRNFETNIENIIATLSAANTKNLKQTLDDAILQAGEEVKVMWKYMEHLYTKYTIYSTEIIQEKVQNMTAQISHWIDLQGKYNTSLQYERASMCYNISLANVEISKTMKTIVQVMDNLYNATQTIYSKQAMYADADQHTLTIIDESKSLLNEYQRKCHYLLNCILKDNFSFLGSAVHLAVQRTHPYIKKYILRKWKSSVLSANLVFDSNFSIEPMIKEEYSSQISNSVEEILTKLGDVIKMKAVLLQDEVTEKQYMEKAKFDDLSTLMKNKYQNVTNVTHYLVATSLASTVDQMRQNLKEIVDQKLPSLSTLSIQNYLLTDVCPKSANFMDYTVYFINQVIHNHGEGETYPEVSGAKDVNQKTHKVGEVHDDDFIPSILNTQLKKEISEGDPSTNNAISSDAMTGDSSQKDNTTLQVFFPEDEKKQIVADNVKNH